MTVATAALADRLRGTLFLHGLPDSYFWRLARAVSLEAYPVGETIFAEGSERRLFAILLEGSVAIEKVGEERAVRLGTLGPGEGIGEGLLLGDTSAHGTTARTLAEVDAAVMSRRQLEELIRENPPIYAALVQRAARAIAQRLRAADATLVGHGRTVAFTGGGTRREHDLLGEREVPRRGALRRADAARARELPDHRRAAARVPGARRGARHGQAGRRARQRGARAAERGDGRRIVPRRTEVRAGRHHEHFLVDMVQGGAGTSTNMNANEVLANRANELLERRRGDFDGVHPNNHVNLSQSTNDVYPTALKLALHRSIDALRTVMRELAEAFLAKGEEFAPHVKMGRTQLQDAVPMTLGQEFAAFGHTILEDVDRLAEVQGLIREINMGATAIGTKLNAPPGYPSRCAPTCRPVTGLALITAPDLVEATADTGVFVQLSGVLKRCAVKLSKICNDLRLLSSGPRAGFGEINLPADAARVEHHARARSTR
jgi:aspartate ammonia-lyase